MLSLRQKFFLSLYPPYENSTIRVAIIIVARDKRPLGQSLRHFMNEVVTKRLFVFNSMPQEKTLTNKDFSDTEKINPEKISGIKTEL